MTPGSLIRRLRTYILKRLGIETPEHRTGLWWELDLLLVILLGTWAFGLVALFSK